MLEPNLPQGQSHPALRTGRPAVHHAMRKSWLAAWLLILASVGVSCAPATNTKIVNVWRDTAFKPTPARRVLVIGVADKETSQRLFEDAMVGRLKARGVEGLESARVLPAGIKLDKAAVESAIKDKGIDLVLVTKLISVAKGTEIVEGSTYYSRTPLVYDYYGWYVFTYDEVHTPSTLKEYTVADLETRVWDVGSAKMV